MEDEYPSIISQPGSASRNLPGIIEGLRPLVASSSSTTQRHRPTVFEIGSYPYEHIRGYARAFPDVQWWGSCRDDGEIGDVLKANESDNARELPNMRSGGRPSRLDIGKDEDWRALVEEVKVELLGHEEGDKDGDAERGGFAGVLMVNIVHCCPEGLPEEVFSHLNSSELLDRRRGWVAAYGPWLADDGSYRSPGDEKFDNEYIRARHASLGLRTIPSVSAMARRHGFVEESRTEMARGNVFVVWRRAKLAG